MLQSMRLQRVGHDLVTEQHYLVKTDKHVDCGFWILGLCLLSLLPLSLKKLQS